MDFADVSPAVIFTDYKFDREFILFIVSLIIGCLLSAIALLTNFVLIRLLRANVILPKNVIILLFNISIGTVLLCVRWLLFAVWSLFLGRQTWQTKVLTPLACQLTKLPTIFGFTLLVSSLHAAGIERLWATKKVTKYVVYIGRIICLSPWVLSVAAAVISLVGDYSTWLSPHYCTILAAASNEPSTLRLILGLVVGADLISVGILGYLWYRNRHVLGVLAVNQARSSLSSRFQMKRTVELTQMLLPSISLHCFVHLFACVIVWIDFQIEDDANPINGALANGIALPLLIQLAAHPLICIYRGKALRRACAGLLRAGSRPARDETSVNLEEASDSLFASPASVGNVIDSHHMTFETHNDILLKTWKGELKKTKKYSHRRTM